jgi:hypothetical protein
MSYDLTIRPDESFSQFKPLAPLALFLAAQSNVKPNGNRGFALEDGNRWMEIDLETVNEEGDNIEDESTDPETFNCFRAHIPYPRLGEHPESDYFPLLLKIAQQLGWELQDEQRDGEPPENDDAQNKPWWKFW